MKRSTLLPRSASYIPPSSRLQSTATISLLSSVDQITPSLYLSNASVARHRGLLSAKRITCVINATLDVQRPSWPGVDYLRVPVADLPHAQLSDYFDRVADRIRMVERRNGRTLVHCMAGVSRSATLCMAYLMKYEGVTLKEAHHWVRSRRPAICPNIGFWRQLIAYEHQLFGKNSVKLAESAVDVLPVTFGKYNRM
ncbi:hypothetical protein NDU88_001769 [Pleurodeles waltl]|uniref:Protein-tyrosine-phosphatase n=1 Tax=Pleurodeles waltl TaxID=8319 RepID=A0AAV7RBU2_PLEWA|nr:hypothetical protein NDU88_001769 [Pleurodeles waltl]